MKALLIVLALMVIVAALGIMQVRQNNIEARREAIAMEGHRKAAEEKLDLVEKSVSNTVSIAGRADAYGPMGSNLVVGLLGDSAFPKAVIPQYPAPVTVGVASNVSPRASDDNPAGLPTREELDRRRARSARSDPLAIEARPERPPRFVQEPPRATSRVTDDNPAGLPTREELDRMRAGGAREPEPKALPAAEKPAEPAVVPVRPDVPPRAPAVTGAWAKPVTPEEPIMIMLRQLQADLAAIQETAQKARDIGGQARMLYEGAMNARTSSNAHEKVVAMTPLVDESAKLRDVAIKQFDIMKKRYADMGKEKARVEQERQVRAEIERKRIEEETRKALVASEVQRGGETHRAVLPAIKKFRFSEALETAKGFQEQMKTAEGRAAVQPGIDLCSRLVAFKRFLIEQMSAEPYRWGWGEGSSARDILGANDDGIRHSTGSAAWPEVSLKQLIKVIEHYVGNEKLGAKVRGEQYLGASLLLRDLDAGEPAELYGRRAVQHVPSLEGELTRLK